MINLHLLPIYGDKYPSGILCYTYSSILAHYLHCRYQAVAATARV